MKIRFFLFFLILKTGGLQSIIIIIEEATKHYLKLNKKLTLMFYFGCLILAFLRETAFCVILGQAIFY